MTTLGMNIQATRKVKHLSLSQLALVTGLTKGFLSQMESGRSNPSLASLNKIALALGVRATDLLSSSQPEETSVSLLVPATPTIVSTPHPVAQGGDIQVIRAAEDGTHLLVDLSDTTMLSSETVYDPTSVLCLVLEGSVQVAQHESVVQVPSGAVAAWDGGQPYTVAPSAQASAQILLFLPRPLSLPGLSKLRPAELIVRKELANSTDKHATRRTASSGDGPLRLVAMRAQRLAERKRNP